MPPLFFNGRFTAQRVTGVQRVAHALLHALDRHPAAARCVLLCPPSGTPPALQRVAVRRVGPAALPLHAWEQAVLPMAASGGRLVNLAGGVPAFGRPSAVLMHDAAVFDHPEAYTGAFVAWYRWLYRHQARRGAQLLTISAFSRARLAAALGVPQARFALMPPGADHLRAVAADERVLLRLGLRGRPFLLAVGSANPTKNLAALVAARARLGAEAPPLVIAGGANPRVFRDGEAADPPGVLRAGPVDDAALVALYRHALALVFPSTYEGFGLPPLEAMGFGCPVLATRCAAIPEACGDAAHYLDGPDADAIEAGLRRIVGDAALRERLRAGGPAHAARFGWDAAADTLLRALDAHGSAPR